MSPERMNSCDVLQTSVATSSQSAFGFRVRILTGYPPDEFEFEELLLYYVSPKVVADRTADYDGKETGVVEGWYVIAKPNTTFELHISLLDGKSSVKNTAPDADVILAKILVDGIKADAEEAIFEAGEDYDGDVCFPGFVENCKQYSSTRAETTMRRLMFRKAGTESHQDEVPSDEQLRKNPKAASFRLLLYKGKMGKRQRVKRGTTKFKIAKTAKVSEKAAIKKGVSLCVERDGVRITEESPTAFNREIIKKRALPGCNLTIYVRELSWMQSRRLIDEDGYACTREKAKELLKEMQAQSRGNRSTSNQRVASSVTAVPVESAPRAPGQRNSQKDENQVQDVKQEGVIDLTSTELLPASKRMIKDEIDLTGSSGKPYRRDDEVIDLTSLE